MRAGRASTTAVMVCKARAFASATLGAHGFHDPTALALLPDDVRADVEKSIAHPAKTFAHAALAKRAAMMLVRTMVIDDAVRDAAAPQVVILGAGLDGRAWRMRELAEATVFEVDHPDSQRDKRARVDAMTPLARDVRFVPVDFTRDDLEAALATAGHDPARPTMWIWEGVVMYLARDDIRRTMHIVERRSAPGSRIAILYHVRSWLLPFVGAFVRRAGEPLRSIHTPDEIRAMLAGYRFRVIADDDIHGLAAKRAAGLERDTRPMTHLRIAIGAK